VAVHAAQKFGRLQVNGVFALRALEAGRSSRAAELAPRDKRRPRCDANQHVSGDFAVGKTRLPEFEQFQIREAARRTVKRIVQNNVLVVDIHKNRVMACRHVRSKAMIEDCTNAGLTADPESLKWMPGLKCNGGKASALGVADHQVGRRR
jgi:hypothetical protein